MTRLLLVAATDRTLSGVDGAEQLFCGIGPVEVAVQTARTLSAASYSVVVQRSLARPRLISPRL